MDSSILRMLTTMLVRFCYENAQMHQFYHILPNENGNKLQFLHFFYHVKNVLTTAK